MPAHWSANKSTTCSDSTTVAELDSLHQTLKNNTLPIASLFEFLMGRPIAVEIMEDNTTAIQAAKDGYTPKLRYLNRTKRIDLEFMKEVLEHPRHTILYCDSSHQKGDMLTKEMDKKRFEECKILAGLGAVVLRGGKVTMMWYSNGKLTHGSCPAPKLVALPAV